MKGQGWTAMPTHEGRPAIYYLNPGRLFVQQPKRERDREAHLNYYASTYRFF